MTSNASLEQSKSKTAAFSARKLAPSLFMIVEHDDVFSERPFIYAKFLSGTLVLVDTGCGGRTNNPRTDVRSLREFVETWPVRDNGEAPLNKDGELAYTIVCTHCHYDHILAVEQFEPDTLILASGHDPKFLAPDVLPQHTLCARLGLRVPSYSPTLIEHNAVITGRGDGSGEGLLVLHTPGHTPDSLSLWDARTRGLFVGDTVYEREPIIFPPQGDIVRWFATMDFLIDFVRKKNAGEADEDRVLLHAGHDTSGADAMDVLEQGRAFVVNVVRGTVKLKDRRTVDGITVVSYERSDRRFSLRCPEKLVLDARNQASGLVA